MKYPGHITIRRAFLYSLICKDNTSSINLVEFLAGCNRFGIDNPAPTIQKRIGFYGNEEDIEEIFKKQLDGYNAGNQLQMHTTRNRHHNLKIEAARLKSQDSKERMNESQQITTVTPTKNKQPGIMNLKLLGQAHNQLESDLISGTHKIRINIGKA